MKKILIMGLPGSGKTTLAKILQEQLKCPWFNADNVRKQFDDWDFSKEGRLRQAVRMRNLCEMCPVQSEFAIVDFVAPTEEIRTIFDADLSIWMNTIDEGRFENTNKIFEKPDYVEIEITSFDYSINDILNRIRD